MRTPLITIVSGAMGMGKTFTTKKIIEQYIKKHKRNVLIIDINDEYRKYKEIEYKYVGYLEKNDFPSIRRVVPRKKGENIDVDELTEVVYFILNNFRNGLLVMEDLNQYITTTNNKKIIGVLVSNRHRNLDIIVHIQSLSALTKRLKANAFLYRMHYQIDDIYTIKDLPSEKLFHISSSIVKNRFLNGDKYFYVWIDIKNNQIIGNYKLEEFKKAVKEYYIINKKMFKLEAEKMGINLKKEEEKEKLFNSLLKENLYYSIFRDKILYI